MLGTSNKWQWNVCNQSYIDCKSFDNSVYGVKCIGWYSFLHINKVGYAQYYIIHCASMYTPTTDAVVSSTRSLSMLTFTLNKCRHTPSETPERV